MALVGLASLGVPEQVSARAIPATRFAAVRARAGLKPGHAERVARDLPWRANLIAVSFRGDDPSASGVAIRVRARGATGWDPYDLVVEPDEGPDTGAEPGSTGRIVTLPQWVGTADRVEVQLRAAPRARPVRDVRVLAFNTVGDAEPVPAPIGWLRAIGGFLTMRAATPAQALTTMPDLIRRSEWGADESLRTEGPGVAPALKMAFVHHTAGTNSYDRDESAAIVRGIYAYHVKGRGFSDIAYNFLVDRYGQIFEGRKGSIGHAQIGAHAGGFNTGSVGVSLMGTFTDARPPAAMLNALEDVLAWKLDMHHVPPKGSVTMTASEGSTKFDVGTKVDLHRISGHRDAQSTACPGQRTYNRLDDIRDAVAALGNPKIYLPRLSTGRLRPDGDGIDDSVEVTARFSREVDWTLTFADEAGAVWWTKNGTGTTMAPSWSGVTAQGLAVPSGRYRWTITAARSTTGTPATPATGTLNVLSLHPRGCAGCFGVAPVADFDGDGTSDIAIGVPGEDVGDVRDAGSINVLYGSDEGLSADADQLWHADVEGVRGAPRVGDGFGYALAAGDFDADGYADLAIGSPRADPDGFVDAGAVTVLYGSSGGLTATGDDRWREGLDGVPGTPASGDGFGAALTAGDFDGDGAADLAIGVPGRDEGAADAGAVVLLEGSTTGLVPRAMWGQGTPGVRGAPEAADAFGSSLAAADLDGDGRDDLANGAPGETLFDHQAAGMVNVLYGSGSGLTAAGDQRWNLRNVTVDPEGAEPGDAFGFSVAAADVTGDGRADLVAGAPGETLAGKRAAGAVVSLPGSSTGLTTAGAAFITQDTGSVPGVSEAGDSFGASVAVARFDADPSADVVVGIPGEDIDGVNDAGGIVVLPGSATGPLGIGSLAWNEAVDGVRGVIEPGDVFGFALGAGDFDGDTFGDLAVGVPGQEVSDVRQAGAVAVLYGSATGLNADRDQRWTQDSYGIKDRVEPVDLLGAA